MKVTLEKQLQILSDCGIKLATGITKDHLLTSYHRLQGQDCLIGCSTPEQLSRLRKETGLDFQWLS
jgi:hypothetical protein